MRPLSVPRELLRILLRDPEHLCERMVLFASGRLAEPAQEWAQHARSSDPDADLPAVARRLAGQSARVAGMEGAVAGTPFYVALVPGYINYLWQEVRMTLRIAALYGHDPSALRVAAETLWLRKVYPTLEAAEAGIRAVRDTPLPARPDRRRPLKVWLRSVQRILVFGGFMGPPRTAEGARWRFWLGNVTGVAAFVAGWVITWLFPATLMLLMAWGCETHTRRLFHDAAEYYSGERLPARSARETAAALRARNRRQLARGFAVALSIAVPITFLVVATHERNVAGLDALSATGILVAISVVLAMIVYGRR